jgi:hypothetical protein
MRAGHGSTVLCPGDANQGGLAEMRAGGPRRRQLPADGQREPGRPAARGQEAGRPVHAGGEPQGVLRRMSKSASIRVTEGDEGYAAAVWKAHTQLTSL